MRKLLSVLKPIGDEFGGFVMGRFLEMKVVVLVGE
jgi:hypothetical protein